MWTANRVDDSLSETAGGIFSFASGSGDARSTRILAKTIYRELRNAGLCEREVVAVATELLSQTAADLKNR
jgi:hypothetical protein